MRKSTPSSSTRSRRTVTTVRPPACLDLGQAIQRAVLSHEPSAFTWSSTRNSASGPRAAGMGGLEAAQRAGARAASSVMAPVQRGRLVHVEVRVAAHVGEHGPCERKGGNRRGCRAARRLQQRVHHGGGAPCTLPIRLMALCTSTVSPGQPQPTQVADDLGPANRRQRAVVRRLAPSSARQPSPRQPAWPAPGWPASRRPGAPRGRPRCRRTPW